jgi:hypothetical protein
LASEAPRAVEHFERAVQRLWQRRVFEHQGREIVVAILLRYDDWRPLKAPWWRGKEVCIIGADLDGNFLLRHCDGSVRLWSHKTQSDEVLAKSPNDFALLLRE